MQMLESKLGFMKDLQVEYQSSLHSVEFLRDNYEVMLDHMESQIARRTHEKGRFVTKIGLSLRELILQHYSSVVRQIRSSYSQSQEIYLHLLEQQQALHETICYAQPLLRDLQNLTAFTSEKTLKYTTLKAAISKEEKIIRESRQLKEKVYDKDYQMNIKETSKGKSNKEGGKQRRYRLNLMLIDKLGNQGLVEVGEKIWRAQVEELNCVIEQCLNSTADFNYLKSTLKLRPKSRSFNIANSRPAEAIEHYKSLGLQSALGEKEQLEHSQINLMCDQDINEMMVISRSNSLTFGDLQRITERDEYLQSDESSPLGILKESTVWVH